MGALGFAARSAVRIARRFPARRDLAAVISDNASVGAPALAVKKDARAAAAAHGLVHHPPAAAEAAVHQVVIDVGIDVLREKRAQPSQTSREVSANVLRKHVQPHARGNG